MERIVDAFTKREDEEYFSHLASYEEVKENVFNLSVSTYVEKADLREKIDIEKLNAQIKEIVTKEQELREAIEAVVAEIA